MFSFLASFFLSSTFLGAEAGFLYVFFSETGFSFFSGTSTQTFTSAGFPPKIPNVFFCRLFMIRLVQVAQHGNQVKGQCQLPSHMRYSKVYCNTPQKAARPYSSLKLHLANLCISLLREPFASRCPLLQSSCSPCR